MGVIGRAIGKLIGKRCEVEGFGRYDDKRGVSEADVVIMAVRAESFAEVADQLWLDAYGSDLRDRQLIISVMAGVTLDALCYRLGSENVVRALPGPGLVQGQSLTVWLPAPRADIKRAATVIGMWGRDLQLEDEAQFDMFTVRHLATL
jgi:Pyrroline-5-carboxylate reductase